MRGYIIASSYFNVEVTPVSEPQEEQPPAPEAPKDDPEFGLYGSDGDEPSKAGQVVDADYPVPISTDEFIAKGGGVTNHISEAVTFTARNAAAAFTAKVSSQFKSLTILEVELVSTPPFLI